MLRDITILPLTYQQARTLKDQMTHEQEHCEDLLSAACNFLAATTLDRQQQRGTFFNKQANQRIYQDLCEAFKTFDAANKTDDVSVKIRSYCERLVDERLQELEKNKDALFKTFTDNPDYRITISRNT
jgi:hypothetical protein